MYGTVMIATAHPGRQGDLLEASQRWLRERGPQVNGFIDEHVLISDDGSSVIAAVRFESAKDYEALGADPAQDDFYRRHIEPLVDGEVRWVDGTWHEIAR